MANRAELRTVLDFLRKGDVLIVTRIDRLARSIGDLQDIGSRCGSDPRCAAAAPADRLRVSGCRPVSAHDDRGEHRHHAAPAGLATPT
jgi:hypothetical protein